MRYLTAAAVLIVALLTLIPHALAYPAPTQDQIKKLIVDECYPASKPTDICKTTVDFKDIVIAKPNALSAGEAAWTGTKSGKVITPVKATFRVVQRTQIDPKEKPSYTVKEITQVYNYTIDEFGKPGLSMISHSANREKTLQYNDPTPPGKY